MTQIHTLFERIGARVDILAPASGAFELDVRDDEVSEVRARADVEVKVVDTDARIRHLLLQATIDGDKQKFLCGHDERHWFAAAVPGRPATVRAAMEALKPLAARAAQDGASVRPKDRNRRRNKGYVRQGEWFFIPRPHVAVDRRRVLRDEPIRRSASGKPHVCQFVYRHGGELVYVSRNHPYGLTTAQYRRLPEKQRRRESWTTMRRNPAVYARGTVRHADHATITLDGWHEVVMNTENQTAAMRHVAFLD